MKWYHTVMMATPVVYMLGTVLPGCTTEMCPTEEEKAAAKENGTELVEGEDCLGNEQFDSDGKVPETTNKPSAPSLAPAYVESIGEDMCCWTGSCGCGSPSP